MEGDAPGAVRERGGSGGASPPASPAEDVRGRIDGVLSSASPILDLSKSGLRHLEEIFKIPMLKVSGRCWVWYTCCVGKRALHPQVSLGGEKF